ncbi:MAG TPA: VCBS repeat-containing protein [Polyangiales bacterium]|nr:VCBS repeat-containing protein [Polyangiales bacterium]
MLQTRSPLAQGLLSLFLVLVVACASDPPKPKDAGAEDAGSDAGFDAGMCEGVICSDGQICEVAHDEANCVPSCENVECESDQHCEIVERAGKCVDRCVPLCGTGQRCEDSECIDNTCDDLECTDKEVCADAESGSGKYCRDNTCDDDLDCPDEQSCNDGVCVGDACMPGARRCDERKLYECAANGSNESLRMTCSDAPHTASECSESNANAFCTCRDDWDCPEYSHCSQGRCEGTGRTPHCLLPPTGFAALLPSDEPGFPWGGDDSDGYESNGSAKNKSPVRSRDAAGHPFPRHAQATTTPMVANLDDDNGDGLINELDLPEIIFTSYCGTNYFNHGVLRALHGGGPNAGKELFARCETKLWHEGDPLTDSEGNLLAAANCGCDAGAFDPTGAVAVGDLNADGLPEIVVVAHAANAGAEDVSNNRVLILDRRGQSISDNMVAELPGTAPAVTLANLDGEGLAEIVVGDKVLILKSEAGVLNVAHVLSGKEGKGLNAAFGAVSCVADLNADGRQEIIAGGTAYELPKAPSGVCPADAAALSDEARAYCAGELRVLWSSGVDGFCAVADVLSANAALGDRASLAGPSAPLDGEPEVILISEGRLRIYTRSGELRVDEKVTDGAGGAPNVDDFDGDGFPEIGTAGATRYVLFDLQQPVDKCPAWPTALSGQPASQAGANPNPARKPPEQSCDQASDCGDPAAFTCGTQGHCVCLHNGWKSVTQDASSNATGSSVFDFNGDGAAEVVYNDECFFRIYDGTSGSVYQRLASQSPTRIEYPVVADVDNDGNAEIVISVGNARRENCPDLGNKPLHNGVRVLGDPSDRWIAARRIWNQHAYHVTNVLESSGLPLEEVPSWISYGNRRYNSYRSNVPQSGHAAPDLKVSAVSITSPGVTCGQALSNDIRVVARIVNEGDLRVGQNVLVRFYNQDEKLLGERALGVNLEPTAEIRVTLDYHADSTEMIPKKVRAVVDATEQERECVEDNNALTQAVSVEVGNRAELSVSLQQLDQTCPIRHVRLRVENSGTVGVDEVPVELYAGRPSGGGALLAVHRIGPVDSGGNKEIEVEIDSVGRDLTVFALVNPDSAISECDESNNTAQTQIMCAVVLQ